MAPWPPHVHRFHPPVVRGSGKAVVRACTGVFYNAALLGETVDLNPFGANFPSIGVNNRGEQINAHTPRQFHSPTTATPSISIIIPGCAKFETVIIVLAGNLPSGKNSCRNLTS